MKKIFVIVLAWMLILPGFAAAADDVALPPVPASGNVTLPLDEYNQLVELASKPTRKPDTPPVPYTMKRADLKFRVANESVQGTVQLQGEILHKGATKIPLTTGMAVLDARQEGKGLPLELDNGTHTAVLTGPADFAVTTPAFHSALKPDALPSVSRFHRRAACGLPLLFPATTPTFESAPASSPPGPQIMDKPP